jgi:hypothetical protein
MRDDPISVNGVFGNRLFSDFHGLLPDWFPVIACYRLTRQSG